MHISLCLSTLIYTFLISTVCSIGLGSSVCEYYGAVDIVCGNLTILPITSLPKECSSFLYDGFTVDMNYNINFTFSVDDKRYLLLILNSSTPVIVSYGHHIREDWTEILGCVDPVTQNAVDEMKSLQAFMVPYSNITGLLLTGLQPNENSVDCPNFSKNLVVYICEMKKTFPKLIIGIDIPILDIIYYNTQPHNVTWLDIGVIDAYISFYVISFFDFNSCTDDLRYVGIIPESGCATNTLEKVKCTIKEMKISSKKLLFGYILNSISKDSPYFECKNTYSEICRKRDGTSDVCADTQDTLKSKGKFAKANGNGFVASFIDLDDTVCACKCNTPFPAFQALLDGFNNASSKSNCSLFNRQ